MRSQVILIRPVQPAVPGRAPATPTRVVGDPARTRAVLDALVSAVAHDLGDIGPTARWLRELRLGEDEAFVFIAPDLGHDGVESAEIAFNTLRRVLPDTDIYVSAAAA